jgi:hypothetical protein
MASDVLRWCPHCRRVTQNALTSPPVYDAPWIVDQAASGEEPPRVARLKRYCAGCGEIWESVEAPISLLDELPQLQEKLEDARRQLAMLRLLLARDRHEEESESRHTIPLRRAA